MECLQVDICYNSNCEVCHHGTTVASGHVCRIFQLILREVLPRYGISTCVII